MTADDLSIATVVSLVSLLVGFGLGYRRSRVSGDSFQNSGEAYLSGLLQSQFPPPDYHLLNHLTLPTKAGSTQIDHVLVSRFGVFVIETKHFRGWIYASADDRQWTQVLHRARFQFLNPIHQNFAHVLAVRELLNFLPADDIVSIVAFTGNAEFKTPVPEGVFHPADLVKYLKGRAREVMPVNRMQFCVGRLEAARLAITRATDVAHIEGLRRKYQKND